LTNKVHHVEVAGATIDPPLVFAASQGAISITFKSLHSIVFIGLYFLILPTHIGLFSIRPSVATLMGER
jgi:hypothetical protein